MYQDPKRVRRRYGAINLDDYEAALIDALINYTGVSKAELVREMLMKEALETLGAADLQATSRVHAQAS